MIRRLLFAILALTVIGGGIAAAYSYLSSPEFGRRLMARIDGSMPFRMISATPPINALLPLPHMLLQDATLSFSGFPFTASVAGVRVGMDMLSLIEGAPTGIDLQLNDVTLRADRGANSPAAVVLFLAGLTDRLAQSDDWQRIGIHGLRYAGLDTAVSSLPAIAGISITRRGRQIDIDMDGQLNGSDFIIQVSSLPLEKGRRLQARIRLLEPAMSLTANARYVPEKPLNGRFEGKLAALSSLPWLARLPNGALSEDALRVSGRFVLDANSLTITESDIFAGQGKMRLKGHFPLGSGDGRGFSADLALSHMTIEPQFLRYLVTLGGFSGKEAFALPELRGRFTLNADALSVHHGLLRDTRLRGTFLPDGFIVEELTSSLPGEGRMQLSGKLRPGRFQGSVSLEADNLRALLDWLGIETAAIAPQRLRSASLAAGIDLDRDNLRLQGLVVRIDGAKINGAATIGLRRRPSFALNAAVDRADLDAYFPALRQEIPNALATSYCGGTLTALSGLKRLDTNTRIEAKSLTLGGRRYSDARLDITLFNGDLVVNEVTLGDTAGNNIALSGRIEADTSSLDLRGHGGVEAGSELAAALIGEGAVRAALPFAGNWHFTMAAGTPCSIALKGHIAGGNGEATALINGNDISVLDAAINNVSIQRLAALNPLFSLVEPVGKTTDIQTRLDKRAGSSDAQPVMLMMRWPGDTRLEAKGRWTGSTQRFDGRLRLEASEAGRLLHLLSGESLPVTDKPIGSGALSGDGTVTSDRLTIEDFSLLLGPISARGSLQLTGYPSQPELSADLAFGHVPLGQVLKLPRSGIDAWRLWSETSDPFSLTLPERLNARIALTAKSLEADQWRLSDLGLMLQIDPQAIHIDKATATGYGGGISFAAALQGGDPLNLNGELALTGIDLTRLSDSLSLSYLQDKVLTGRADLSLRLQGQGYAPAGLIASLNGTYRLDADGLALVSRQTVTSEGGGVGEQQRPLSLVLPSIVGKIENGIVDFPSTTISVSSDGDRGRLVLQRGRLFLGSGAVDIRLDTDLPWHKEMSQQWQIEGPVTKPDIGAVTNQ